MVKVRMWQSSEVKNSTLQQPINRASSVKDRIKSNQPNENEDKIKAIKLELESLVGLNNVKKHINEIYAFAEIQKRRSREKLHTEAQALHMVFKGNPGTGKTTVARILGKLFREAGILPKGHLQEVERADLVGEYIGHTAQKTREQIRKSLGGILFIDEAYSLARGGEKDFGKEAIDTIVKGMEDNKDNLIIILAGYKYEMEKFMDTNPGLRSRFPIHITFPDYSTAELTDIADLMLQQRQYLLSSGAREELIMVLKSIKKLHEHNGNARLVRNLIERAMRVQAVRLVKMSETTREDLMVINRQDMLGARESIDN
ncbi:AAA family ATPase [Desulfotruncus alcoholivorax]|uniref:AAA family ATPase n=1 Tax=Desulfotruncus alcoholivorax TaxID=265477 RepID=UPI000421DC16|nr:AAA family ATPase [Desulfotruncus alcoholivorax]